MNTGDTPHAVSDELLEPRVEPWRKASPHFLIEGERANWLLQARSRALE